MSILNTQLGIVKKVSIISRNFPAFIEAEAEKLQAAIDFALSFPEKEDQKRLMNEACRQILHPLRMEFWREEPLAVRLGEIWRAGENRYYEAWHGGWPKLPRKAVDCTDEEISALFAEYLEFRPPGQNDSLNALAFCKKCESPEAWQKFLADYPGFDGSGLDKEFDALEAKKTEVAASATEQATQIPADALPAAEKTARKIAAYRRRRNLHGGWIILVNGKPEGWTADLSKPAYHAPGTLVVNEDGERQVAIGDDGKGGAAGWQPVKPALPVPPEITPDEAAFLDAMRSDIAAEMAKPFTGTRLFNVALWDKYLTPLQENYAEGKFTPFECQLVTIFLAEYARPLVSSWPVTGEPLSKEERAELLLDYKRERDADRAEKAAKEAIA